MIFCAKYLHIINNSAAKGLLFSVDAVLRYTVPIFAREQYETRQGEGSAGKHGGVIKVGTEEPATSASLPYFFRLI